MRLDLSLSLPAITGAMGGERGATINDAAPLIIAHRCSGSMYPEFSDQSYAWAYDAGLRQLEIDGRILSDGSVGIMHDATVDRTTDGTGNASSLNATAFQALNIDYASWFGGDYGTLHPPLAFDVIDKFNGRVAFHIEGKDADAMTAIVARLDSIGARKDQYVLSSFSLTTARIALNAGYAAAPVATGATDMAAIWAEGFRWVFMAGSETDELIQQYVGQGFNVLIYTYERRIDRDRYLALGVRGIYTDDAQYTAGNVPIATRDTWSTQKWMPGMLGWGDRGGFQSGGWWGWATYVGVANMNMGWACPIKNDEQANDFTIEMDARVHAVGTGTDWFAVWIADDATRDKLYSNSTTLPGAAGYFGYLVMFRQNGRIQIYKQNEATLTNVYTDGPTFTADGTTVYKVRVRVTPTQIIGEKIDANGIVLQSTVMTDSTYRGGYFSIHKLTNMRAMFRNLVVSPSGDAPAPVIDPDAQAIINAMTSPPTGLRQSAINNLVLSLKADNVWNDLDVLYLTAAHDAQASRLNWKAPASYTLTPNNSPTFVTDRGWTGDGSTSYLGSGYLPATNGANWSINNASICAWTRTEMQESAPAAGAGTAYVGAVTPRNGSGNAEGLLNRTGTTLAATTASSIGMTLFQRRGASDERIWKNGVQTASGSAAAVGRPTGELRICGRSPSTYSTQQVAFAAAGASLADKEPAFYSAINTYMLAVGAA